MMKKHELIFSLAKLPLDFTIIFSSFFFAKNIREINDFIPGFQLPIHLIKDEYLAYFAAFGAALYLLIFSLHGLYSLSLTSSKVKEFLDIIIYSFYWFVLFSFVVYFTNGILYGVEIPRLIIIYSVIFGAI